MTVRTYQCNENIYGNINTLKSLVINVIKNNKSNLTSKQISCVIVTCLMDSEHKVKEAFNSFAKKNITSDLPDKYLVKILH